MQQSRINRGMTNECVGLCPHGAKRERKDDKVVPAIVRRPRGAKRERYEYLKLNLCQVEPIGGSRGAAARAVLDFQKLCHK